jgi:hypothetical protein
MAEHRPLVKAKRLTQRFGVGSQIFKRHGRDGLPVRAAVAAMVIKDQRALVC